MGGLPCGLFGKLPDEVGSAVSLGRVYRLLEQDDREPREYAYLGDDHEKFLPENGEQNQQEDSQVTVVGAEDAMGVPGALPESTRAFATLRAALAAFRIASALASCVISWP